MPKVGRKSFAYTPQGRAAAKQYSKRVGQKVTSDKKKKKKSGY
jgi:hypothetical protein